jgi:hypothetical protein
MRTPSTTEARLIEIQSRITKWNEFVRELQVPDDIAPAMLTGRLELLRLAQPRALTSDECGVLYQLIGGLLETNQALQQHSSLVATLASEAGRTIGGITGSVDRLESYANFREPRDREQDGVE